MSTYDEYLQELKDAHSLTAKDCLQRLYELLKLEDPLMSKDDMYDRIVKDCLVIWSRQTILNNMPDELKNPENQESGKKGAKKKKLLTVTNNGSEPTETVGNNSPDSPKEQESTTSIIDEMQPMRVINVDSLRDDIPTEYEPIPQDIIEAERNAHTSDAELREMNLLNEITDLKNKISNDYVHKEIYQAATDDIENLKNQVIAKNKEIKEAVEAANKIAEVRGLPQPSTKSDTDTIADLRQQITELQEVIDKGMKVEFNTASSLPTESPSILGGMVEFPSELFGRFFIDIQKAGRENRHSLFLEVREGKVVSWESE